MKISMRIIVKAIGRSIAGIGMPNAPVQTELILAQVVVHCCSNMHSITFKNNPASYAWPHHVMHTLNNSINMHERDITEI